MIVSVVMADGRMVAPKVGRLSVAVKLMLTILAIMEHKERMFSVLEK